MSPAPWERPCPACRARQAVPLYFNRMAPLDGLDLSYRVARCGGCGFAYTDRLASPDAYARYYRTLSKYDSAASVAAIASVHVERARVACELCAPHVRRDEAVVDLGCGPGVLLDRLRSAGWTRLGGLDPAPRAAEQARRLYGLEGVRSGTLAEAAEKTGLREAGLVCLTGVLEHLPRLREDLEALLDAVPEPAKVLVEVPALERFCAGRFEPFGEFSLEHLQYFCADSLARLFSALGYRPLALRLVALAEGTTDSLFGLFARAGGPAAPAPGEPADIDDYVRRSDDAFGAALRRIEACSAERIFLYGAGSHTARLLPPLLERAAAVRLAGLVDSNPNLWGKTMGPFTIAPPQALDAEPGACVIVSSFRSQEALAARIAARHPNPLLRLY